MPFFFGVQIQLLSAASDWNLLLEIRIHHIRIRIHSSHFRSVCTLLIWIRILSIWIRILTLKLRFLSVLSVLSEGFALEVRFILETLSNLIRNNNTSVLISSKSNKNSILFSEIDFCFIHFGMMWVWGIMMNSTFSGWIDDGSIWIHPIIHSREFKMGSPNSLNDSRFYVFGFTRVRVEFKRVHCGSMRENTFHFTRE